MEECNDEKVKVTTEDEGDNIPALKRKDSEEIELGSILSVSVSFDGARECVELAVNYINEQQEMNRDSIRTCDEVAVDNKDKNTVQISTDGVMNVKAANIQAEEEEVPCEKEEDEDYILVEVDESFSGDINANKSVK